ALFAFEPVEGSREGGHGAANSPAGGVRAAHGHRTGGDANIAFRAPRNVNSWEIAMRLFCSCLAVTFLAPIVLMAAPSEAGAWGDEGQQLSGLLADRLLEAGDPAVQKKVGDILATDKSNNWTKTDIGSEATWADALREKSPEGRAGTSKWHYVRLDPDHPD